MEKPAQTTANRKSARPEVGTDILKALAELSPSTSLSRLAERADAGEQGPPLPAGTDRQRFCRTERATNHYGLGREALRVGMAALGSMDVLKVATLPLAELRDD
jgi:DNA-binding IclR family transcriptional regulator